MLAHGLGMERLRAAGARRPGIVLNLIPAVAEDPAAEAARTHVDGLHNRFFLDLLTGRGIPADVRETCRSITDWSFVRESDLPIISAPIDWIGENYYTINRISSTSTGADGAGQDMGAYPACPPAFMAPREPRTAMGWEVIESGLVDVLHTMADALPGVPIYVTENGAAFADAVSADGQVHDPARVDYYRRHVSAALQARAEGVPIEGYFAWSLLDNIEWAEGMTKRFGIVRVEPDTLTRIPKDSARWLRDRLAARG
jgi:beta-glucosidase